MTFLLFLASVGVLEYILRRDRAAPGLPPPKKEETASGLMALAQMVEQQGAGPAPAANEEKVSAGTKKSNSAEQPIP